MIDVLLEADVAGLGEKGSLVQVKPAYAENFIVSKGLGSVASKEIIERITEERAAAEAAAKAAKTRAEQGATELLAKFGKVGIVEEVQVSADGVISPIIDSRVVAEAISRSGVSVEASDVLMPEVVELGSVVAEVTLHPEVTTKIKVVVEKSKITFV